VGLALSAGTQVIVSGCIGGFIAQAIPNLGLLQRWSSADKRGLPDRFKSPAIYIVWVAGALLGGVATWTQGGDLLDRNRIAFQIGLVAPLLISVVWRYAPDGSVGSVPP
jgi:hypothetical protein